ncbi:MAG TPA: aminotransferase class V-fold PLP-dependent enzyme [Gemmatimonadaceae bacterium]
MPFDVDALREREFPWAARAEAIYLNNASTGPLPERTLAAIREFDARRAAPYRLSDEIQFATLARGRELIAQLIGAESTEIALAVNTSYGINVAAFGLPLGPGDVVLTPDREFPANVYPWMQLARKRGVVYRRLPTCDGAVDEDALRRELEDPAVRAVSVSWVGFASGYTVDLEAIGRACRARGAFFIVDAIQGLGPLTLDVRACHVDILACGAQKWLLSPWGTGFVYVRRELIAELEPNVVSWMAVKGSDDFRRLVDYDLTWRDDARRFEFITLPFQDFAGMNASLELMHEIGPRAIAEQVGVLADIVVLWAASQREVELVTPSVPRHRAGIVALRMPNAEGVSRVLREAGVSHSFREGAIRLSPHFYNTREEIRRALGIIETAPTHRS